MERNQKRLTVFEVVNLPIYQLLTSQVHSILTIYSRFRANWHSILSLVQQRLTNSCWERILAKLNLLFRRSQAVFLAPLETSIFLVKETPCWNRTTRYGLEQKLLLGNERVTRLYASNRGICIATPITKINSTPDSKEQISSQSVLRLSCFPIFVGKRRRFIY